MANPLYNIPGYGGYLAARDKNEGISRQNLETGLQFQRLGQQEQLQQETLKEKQRQLRLATEAEASRKALGPRPTEDALVQWASQRSDPKDVLHYLVQSRDATARTKATKEAAQSRLQQAASQFEATYKLQKEKARSEEEHRQIDNIFQARKSMLDEAAAQQGSGKIFWETGQRFDLPQLPPIPQPRPAGADFSFQSPEGEVVRGTAPSEAEALMAVQNKQAPGAAVPQAAPPPPAPRPAAPPADPYFHDSMSDEVRRQPPAERAKWMRDTYGTKAMTEMREDEQTVVVAKQALTRMQEQVKQALGSKLGRVTGLMGILPNVPGFAGADAASDLRTLGRQIGMNTLASLRQSANGSSGLGQITQSEHTILQGLLGELESAQSEPHLRNVLGRIEAFAVQAAKNLDDGFKRIHRERIGVPGVRNRAAQEGVKSAEDKILEEMDRQVGLRQ